MARRNALRLIAGALILTMLAGCTRPVHARELQELQTVQTMGFDGAPGAVTVSVSDRRDAEGRSAVRLSAQGAGIVRAVEKLQGWSAREELFFAHIRFAAVGEDAARRGIGEILDWFQRSTQTRLRLPLFIVRGGTAAELVTGSADDNYEITALLASLQRDTERSGSVHCFTLLDVARRLARSGAALCCAVTAAGAEDSVPSAEEGAVTALEAGYAVLKDGALAGWLDTAQARGATLLLGLAGEMSFVLPDGEGGAVTVTLRGGSTEIKPVWDETGAPVLSVRLDYQAGIAGMTQAGELTEELLSRLERELAGALAEDAAAALEASRVLETDFLELYRLFRAAAPRTARLPAREAFLPALRWEVRAHAAVERSYDIDSGPALTGEEGGHAG